jgi:ribonuclease HI
VTQKEAMKEMIQRGIYNVTFESDSKIVVDAISSTCFGSSEFFVLISVIKSMLIFYPNFEVKFSKRQTNKAAHILSRTAYFWFSCCICYVISPHRDF